VFPIDDVFNRFRKLDAPASLTFTAQVVREQINGKINVYASRIQKELLFGIEKYFGDCKEPKIFRNIHQIFVLITAKALANIICEEATQFEDIIISFATAERELRSMRFFPPILSFISSSLQSKLAALPLKFGWNPISQHRDIFVKYFRPIVEERFHQRKKLGEKYVPKEDLLEFFLNDPNFKTDVVDDEYMDELFAQTYIIVFASISTASRFLGLSIFDYARRPELWDEIYEEQLIIHNETNGILGREVYVYAKDTSFNDKIYGKTVNDFQPKRHIISHPNGKLVHIQATKVNRSLLTFGGGKHACPGRFFAVSEIKMCLHKLILRYNIRTESGKLDPPKRICTHTYPPVSGLIFEN
ncbi:3041_t:CDS:2, partial [Cetraspora pellucida]